MDKKRTTAFVIASLMAVSMLSACSGPSGNAGNASGDAAASGGSADNASGSAIRLLNGKSEVDTQIKALASAFEKETGQKVIVESIPAGVEVQPTLKGYYLADQMPDIFVCEGSSFANWEGLLVDMSKEDWAGRTDAAYIDKEYGTLGFPYTTEAIGLAYNADILAKAGIDPAGLTSPAAYEAAFKKLDSMRSELGLTAVSGYCAEDQNLGWSSGNHIFGAYIDSGLARDDTTYIDLLQDGGKIDTARFKDFASFIGLLQKYSDPALLVKGTYDDQVKGFASGKYAFVTQGSWIGAILTGDDADAYKSAGSFKIGMAPYAFEDGMDTILTSAPSWWAVCREGNVDASLKFLQWCSEDAAQKIFVEDAGFVSPFKDCKYVASDPFAQTIADHVTAGKTSDWHWQNMKEGLGTNALAPLFNQYAAGKLDTDGFVDAVAKASADYYSVN